MLLFGRHRSWERSGGKTVKSVSPLPVDGLIVISINLHISSISETLILETVLSESVF